MTGVDASGRGVTRGVTGKPLRILAVHRYYWPDTPPYAVMLRRIVGRWTQDGHHVDVLSSQPSYKAALDNRRRPRRETIDGVGVQRLSLPSEAGRPIIRILNALRLSAALLWKAVRGRYDVIMISTAPPVVGGLAAAMAARLTGARFVYHCMDIHPEVGTVSGEFANPAVFKLLTKLDNWSCRAADPVVVLSQDMADTLRARPQGDCIITCVLNNFSLPSEHAAPNRLPFAISKDRLTVLFAGNIGRFQGLDTVVEAMARLKHRSDIEFVLMGDGVAKAALEEKARAAGAAVRFVGHQPVEVAKAAMRQADAGFVSLVPDLYRYAYPSKTMTYLEQGCPLIVAVEPESELARDAVAGGFGQCVPVGDSAALAGLLERLADDRSVCARMREAALRKAQADFLESVVLDRWSELLLQDKEAVV